MLNRRQTELSRELFVLFVQLSKKYFVIKILSELMARLELMLVAIHGSKHNNTKRGIYFDAIYDF